MTIFTTYTNPFIPNFKEKSILQLGPLLETRVLHPPKNGARSIRASIFSLELTKGKKEDPTTHLCKESLLVTLGSKTGQVGQ